MAMKTKHMILLCKRRSSFIDNKIVSLAYIIVMNNYDSLHTDHAMFRKIIVLVHHIPWQHLACNWTIMKMTNQTFDIIGLTLKFIDNKIKSLVPFIVMINNNSLICTFFQFVLTKHVFKSSDMISVKKC